MYQEKKVKKFGYVRQDFNISELTLFVRPETSDENIINEVLVRNVYQKKKIGFIIEPSDIWLDLGANIGTFSLLVLAIGGKTIAVEPEPDNLVLLELNLRHNFQSSGHYQILPYAVDLSEGSVDLFLCKGAYNKSRHTLIHKRGRQSISIMAKTLSQFLTDYPNINAIKMDIEGTEIPLLEDFDFSLHPHIKKLVFEYSFDIDNRIKRFINLIDRLKQFFTIVYFTKVKPTDEFYNYFPAATNVYCLC